MNYNKDDKNTVKYSCLCSKYTCEFSMMVKHTPTNIHIALGSVCYLRFNKKNGAEVFLYRGAARCEDCKKPLVQKECSHIKHTKKGCNGRCLDCFENLKVCYDDKDDAKSMGAWWNPEKEEWYAPNKSAKYTALIKKYS